MSQSFHPVGLSLKIFGLLVSATLCIIASNKPINLLCAATAKLARAKLEQHSASMRGALALLVAACLVSAVYSQGEGYETSNASLPAFTQVYSCAPFPIVITTGAPAVGEVLYCSCSFDYTSQTS